MLDGMFGKMFREQEKLPIEPLSEDAKAAVEDARLILLLRKDTASLERLDKFVQFAQEDCARARNRSDENAIESAKHSTAARFGLLDLSEETSAAMTNAIYGG